MALYIFGTWTRQTNSLGFWVGGSQYDLCQLVDRGFHSAFDLRVEAQDSGLGHCLIIEGE